MNDARRIAVVTGASEGLGVEFARVFAERGHDLALVARRADRLEALADEIAKSGRPRPIVVALDLAAADAPGKVAAALKQAGATVEYLVNNAGYGLNGPFADLPIDDQLGMIDLNVRSLTAMARQFLPDLRATRGGMVNVASIAAFAPGPGMAVYYASKAYVLSFTEAMRHELSPLGVRVTVVCPGPVLTEFQARAGFAPGFDSAILEVSAAEVARQGYEGLMANKRAVLPGLLIKLVPFLLRLFPRSFILAAVGGFQLRNR